MTFRTAYLLVRDGFKELWFNFKRYGWWLVSVLTCGRIKRHRRPKTNTTAANRFDGKVHPALIEGGGGGSSSGRKGGGGELVVVDLEDDHGSRPSMTCLDSISAAAAGGAHKNKNKQQLLRTAPPSREATL
jgi:hypothetical protein